MNRNKQVKPKLPKTRCPLDEYSLHKIPALKWKAVTGKYSTRCRVINPRWAFLPSIRLDYAKRQLQALTHTKSIRLFSFALTSYSNKPLYEGQATRLLQRTHYLKKFGMALYFTRRKDFETVRKQILRQKNLQSLALLANWGNYAKFRKIKKSQVQARLLHKQGKNLKKLVLGNVLNKKMCSPFKPQYFPRLETFVFATTCCDVDSPYPIYTPAEHGRFVEKLLSIPTLTRLRIRTCENFVYMEFWKEMCWALKFRKEPIYILVGCGVRGYYNEDDGDYGEEYEKELREVLKTLKVGHVFDYSSSWSVFKIRGEVQPETDETNEGEENPVKFGDDEENEDSINEDEDLDDNYDDE